MVGQAEHKFITAVDGVIKVLRGVRREVEIDLGLFEGEEEDHLTVRLAFSGLGLGFVSPEH